MSLNKYSVLHHKKDLDKLSVLKGKTRYEIDDIGDLHIRSVSGKSSDVFYNEFLSIRGWAVDIQAHDIARGVTIEINGCDFKANYGKGRRDVAEELGDDKFFFSGFEASIPGSEIPDGKYKVNLKIISQKKNSYYYVNSGIYIFHGHESWIEHKKKHLRHFKQLFDEKQQEISKLQNELRLKENFVQDIHASLSWKITKPVRKLANYWILLSKLFNLQSIKNGFKFLRKEGIVPFLKESKAFYYKHSGLLTISADAGNGMYSYQHFIELNEPSQDDIQRINISCSSFRYSPKISIITPVYNVDPKWLNKCIESVIAQYYQNWELCLYDDASTNSDTIKCLEKWQNKDKRIQINFGKKNLNISGASNETIKIASGEFIGLLDNDDELTPDALYEVVKVLNTDKTIDFLYSDEDKLEMNGTFSDPYFKSDFNIDLFLSNNYLCHFSVIRKTIGDKVGWFRKGYEGSQDYDLFLRVIDHTRNIFHIPKVLYHWRMIQGSTAMVYKDKRYANQASIHALTDFLKRNKITGVVENGLKPCSFRIKRKITGNPKISIIIPFKDQVSMLKTCVESIISKTEYKNYEIILVSNNSNEKKTKSYLNGLEGKHKFIKIYEYNIQFNFSKINNWAVRKASGEFVLFLNNDIEVIKGEWLTSMVEHIQRKEVGGVGCTLLYPDNTVQHAGMVLGIGGVAGHAFKHLPDDLYHFHHSKGLIRNVSGCTAACLLVKKKLFEQVGGLDEKNLTIAFNDVDLCIKIRQAGYLIVYTPYAKLLHHESVSRGYEDTNEKQERFKREVEYIKKKWGQVLEKDPYYNQNLTLDREDFSLNFSQK